LIISIAVPAMAAVPRCMQSNRIHIGSSEHRNTSLRNGTSRKTCAVYNEILMFFQ